MADMDPSYVPAADASAVSVFNRLRLAPANQIHLPFPRQDVDSSIPARFEKQVQLFASRIAVESQRHTLTYHDLNQTANRVARAILDLSRTGPGRVALLLAHDAEFIVGLLGCLKAGKTYVPLSATSPEQRLITILADADPELLLADNAHHSLALRLSRSIIPVINIEHLDPRLPSSDLGLAISPDSQAYILYTSGSTGTPKGVIQTHRNILHCTRWYTNLLQFSADDRFSFILSSAYGAAAVVIFSSLLNGATICPQDLFAVEASLHSWLANAHITVHHAVSAVFRHFAKTLSGCEDFSSLRLLCLGGDTAYRADFELYRRYLPSTCTLVHHYGATEIGRCCALLLDKDSEITSSTVPAGYVRDDMHVLILDENGQELSSNEVGQIAIRSRYLSPGYWRRPELTDAAFIAGSINCNERIYLTGDLGRMRPDGCLEYLGRKDFRVKVRGQTIEVAEVETALLDLPAVKEAVVVGQEDSRGESHLVAYLTLYPGPIPTTIEMRDQLIPKLPRHMIPSDFVLLETMPLSANGKVDRRVLPSLGGTRLDRGREFVSPRNSIEQTLAGIWKRLLALPAVGIHDGFFELGGHSLLAMQMLAEIQNAFGRSLPVACLFPEATIEQLAGALTRPVSREPLPSLVPIRPQGTRPPFFFIHGLDGDILPCASLAKHLDPDQPVYALRAQGLEGPDAPVDDLKIMASRYIAELRAVQPVGPYFLGGYSFGGAVVFEMAQQLRAAGEEIGLLVIVDIGAPPSALRLAARRPRFWLQLCLHALRGAPSWLLSLWRSGSGERGAWLRLELRVLKQWLLQTLDDLGLDPPALFVGLGTRQHFVPNWDSLVVRANHHAKRHYCAAVYPGRLILLRGASPVRFWPGNPTGGWDAIVTGGIDVRRVSGSHRELLREPHVRAVAAELRTCLDAAMSYAVRSNP